jgi:hypothetical protein
MIRPQFTANIDATAFLTTRNSTLMILEVRAAPGLGLLLVAIGSTMADTWIPMTRVID